jgi:predicted DNA-binding transcriptional regulator YafY
MDWILDKTERLFAIMDALRRHRHPVTAQALAEEFSVSVRTLYRDVQTLIGLGAPIDGEAGIGYLLRPGFFLPPLMFNADELEALVLGARWVQRQPDEGLADAANAALGKIATASPHDLRDRLAETGLFALPWSEPPQPLPLLAVIRQAIRDERKLLLNYQAENGAISERLVWPVALAFYEDRRTLAAWCELRQAFRHFRVDRMSAATPTEARLPKRRAVLFKDYMGELEAERGD